MRTVLFAYTDYHSLACRLSLSVYTVVQTISHPPTPYPTLYPTTFRHIANASPRPARLRVTALPWACCVSVCLPNTGSNPSQLARIPGKALFPGLFLTFRFKTRFRAISLTCLSVFLSFTLRDRISGYTPRARPRALTGLRLPAVWSPNTCFPGRTYGCH